MEKCTTTTYLARMIATEILEEVDLHRFVVFIGKEFR